MQLKVSLLITKMPKDAAVPFTKCYGSPLSITKLTLNELAINNKCFFPGDVISG